MEGRRAWHSEECPGKRIDETNPNYIMRWLSCTEILDLSIQLEV